jgi:uncharacterized protein
LRCGQNGIENVTLRKVLVNAWWLEYGLSGLIVFVGYFVFGIAGFGSALIIVPALAWNWPLSEVVPLILLMEIPAIVLHTGLNYREVAWDELPPLLPSLVVGAIAGFALMQVSNGNYLLVALGLYIAIVAVRGLRGSVGASPSFSTRGRSLAGFLMGLVETMFATSGPIVMVWLLRRIADPRRLRATMPALIVLLSGIALLAVAFSGVLRGSQVWLRLMFLLPFSLAGILSGNFFARRMPPDRLAPFIYSLLGASGLMLAGGALLRLS